MGPREAQALAGRSDLDQEREAILRAFAELCAERGYAETDLEQVGRRAGVSRDVLGRLFGGDKERCARAAEEAILAEVVAAVGRTYSADRSEWESFVFGVKAILDLMAANPHYAYLGYIVARQMAPHSVLQVYENGRWILGALLERGQGFGGDTPNPAVMASGALGAAEAVVRREVAAGRAARLPQLLPDFVYATIVPLLGQEEALRLARLGRRLLAESAADGELGGRNKQVG